MTWLATALAVIVVPGLVALVLVRRMGPAREPGNVPIQPEFPGGQTIGHSRRLGLAEAFWGVFVLVPATLRAVLGSMIGGALYRKRPAERIVP